MELHIRSMRALAIACACVVTLGLLGCKEEAPPRPEVIRPVKMMEITGEGSGGTREYPGRIKAGQYSEMGFEVEGRVTEFVYKEGQQV